ncbi:unnamed protein product [Didymodactylos carnosus]|uniref:Uncharacterized protein n=1 Tax=Didymodactylos carnosus TaxID=1234261 RepID=A0A815C5D6_9BILA|nr:unnamed protein product [Didymodactylos carnosus]CAF1591254.1 unnamed protein product [Didymodactylos carnosus]CAF4067176.1 unnamed protein product [Didymodactylos carnosus]CAF4395285.1 unnamed protein product [Didymodactylos carnosus]
MSTCLAKTAYCAQFVYDNIQLVSMWLSFEDTTVLDNALITMEHLYKSGVVNIHLKRLMNEQSFFEIEYSVKKIQSKKDDDIDNEEQEQQREEEKIKFILTLDDIEDHKRQLTFCNVDLHQNMKQKIILLSEQLKLLHIIENIYLKLLKLEMSGHPEYQLKNEKYDIYDRTGKEVCGLST